jgi:hypothetical protein
MFDIDHFVIQRFYGHSLAIRAGGGMSATIMGRTSPLATAARNSALPHHCIAAGAHRRRPYPGADVEGKESTGDLRPRHHFGRWSTPGDDIGF